MGETPEQIRVQIEQARHRLGQDLNELEYRVKRTTDWRRQFDRRPWAFAGAAFAGGLFLGWVFSSDKAA
jgi:ElaB/YqjD/DUF883 family membrane-anchored ribosome-binding protein